MSLKETIAADIETVFLNTDDFGETVTVIAADGREVSLTAVVEDEEAPLEDNRSNKRRVEKCLVWCKAADPSYGEPTAVHHSSGPVVIQTGMALRRSGDGRRVWDFLERAKRDGGIVGLRFQRIATESAGDLTPGIGR